MLGCWPAATPPPADTEALLPSATAIGAASSQAAPIASAIPMGVCDSLAPASTQACTLVAKLRVHDLSVRASCYIEPLVHAGDVGKLFDCRGALVADFNGAVFAGPRSAQSQPSNVDVCAMSTYHYAPHDTCTWHTEQHITGTVAGRLRFTYTEAPLVDPSEGPKRCSPPCRAEAVVEVLP